MSGDGWKAEASSGTDPDCVGCGRLEICPVNIGELIKILNKAVEQSGFHFREDPKPTAGKGARMDIAGMQTKDGAVSGMEESWVLESFLSFLLWRIITVL